MKYIYAALIFVALFALVVWSYRMNKKTPKPEGCENLHPECASCGILDCALREKVLDKIDEELEKNGNR